MAHVYISAAHKSSGKTTVSLGLCAALVRRGLSVQPFKKGPDYIDPLWLGKASGRPCYNLDFYTMDENEIRGTFSGKAARSDIALIEGNKGLYDGLDVEGSNSNAAMAKTLSAPIILVLDVQGVIRGAAPLLLGYQAFDEDVDIAGVILNKVGGVRHERKLREVIERYTDIPVLGAIQRDPGLAIEERHLGLVPSNEADEAERRIQEIAAAIEAQVDIDALLAIAGKAPLPSLPTSYAGTVKETHYDHAVRIGIARDEAFGFYYQNDLDALQRAGAELVPFNTLRDPCLPEIDGLFIGGGFPETHMRALAANVSLRGDIKRQIEAGLPVYAECGGMMYLTRRLRWGESEADMVGALPADAVMYDRPQGRGYVRLEETRDAPWPGARTDPIQAHEFHYSTLENVAGDVRFAYRVLRGTGIDGRHDGICYRNVLANYVHMRDTGRHHWARRFVDFIRTCQGGTSTLPVA